MSSTSGAPARFAEQGSWLGRGQRFFCTRESTAAAAYFRVFLATWTLAFFVPRLPYLTELYAHAAALRRAHPLLLLLRVPVLPMSWVWLLILVLFGALGAFACGYQVRRAHVLILLLLAYLFGFDLSTLRGYGVLAFYQWIILYFAAYEPVTSESGAPLQRSRYGVRLLMLQFSSVYAFTVLAKTVGGEGWLDGKTLYYAWRGQYYGRFLLSEHFTLSLGLTQWLGWATLLAEGFVAVGVWHRKTRWLAMLTCVGLHLGMLLTLRVSPLFHGLMLGHLPLFLPQATWRRWARAR